MPPKAKTKKPPRPKIVKTKQLIVQIPQGGGCLVNCPPADVTEMATMVRNGTVEWVECVNEETQAKFQVRVSAIVSYWTFTKEEMIVL